MLEAVGISAFRKLFFFGIRSKPSRIVYLHCCKSSDLANGRGFWEKYFLDTRFGTNRGGSKKYFFQVHRPIGKSLVTLQWRYTVRGELRCRKKAIYEIKKKQAPPGLTLI